MSSAWPNRPMGIRCSRTRFLFSSLSRSRISGVSIGPGQMAFERMPFGPNCTASDLVSAITAPLLAV